MKKITKIISLSLAMMLVLMSFASCGLVEDTANVEKARITKETVLKIADGIEVSGAYYGYYFMSVYNEKLQEASAEMSEEGADSSAAPEIDKEEIKKEAIKRVVATKMASEKAKEEGIVLSTEDNANISSMMEQITTSVSQNGMTFSAFCQVMETSADGIEQVLTDEYLGNLYYAKLVSDEFVSAKHILVEAADESAKPEALSKIKDIQAKINAGEDFDKLMKEFSTDPGLQTQPNGYTFTKGQMVEPFEKASFALEVGGVSDIVETDYGYHIIKRIDTSISGVASALTEAATPEISEKIGAEKDKLSKDVKVEETKKFKYYDSIIK